MVVTIPMAGLLRHTPQQCTTMSPLPIGLDKIVETGVRFPIHLVNMRSFPPGVSILAASMLRLQMEVLLSFRIQSTSKCGELLELELKEISLNFPKVIFSAVIGLLSICYFGCGSSPPNQSANSNAQKQFDAGKSFFENGEYNNAILSFNSAMTKGEIGPEQQLDAMRHLVISYGHLGKFDKASETLELMSEGGDPNEIEDLKKRLLELKRN